MQMLYNSDSFIVVQFDLPWRTRGGGRSGRRIGSAAVATRSSTSSRARRSFSTALMAESFKTGVQAIVDGDATPEAFDEFIGRYTALAQQPLVAH
jgi:hypothetical protein